MSLSSTSATPPSTVARILVDGDGTEGELAGDGRDVVGICDRISEEIF
jgi:hypothetical protein